MDDWIKLRQELKKHHLSQLEEKLLSEVISKLRTKGCRLNADTVAAEVKAAVVRHNTKSAEKKKLFVLKKRGKAERKPRRAK